MVHNNCKHDKEFFLTYIGLESTYAWRCVLCGVFRLPFSPAEAGKIHSADWVDLIAAYKTKENNKPGLALSTDGKF